MKRTLILFSVLPIICVALYSLDTLLTPSRAQQTPTDEVALFPLPVPTNVIGTSTRGTSNDGQRIVFDSINDYNGNNKDSNTEIWVYDVNTRSIIQITDTPADVKDPADANKVLYRLNSVSPAISGDGTKIVFVSNASFGDFKNDDGNYEIYLADLPRGATSATITRITDTGPNFENEFVREIFTNYEPTINDDGSQIGFVSTRQVFNQIPGGAATFTASKEGPNNSDPDGNAEIFLYSATQRQYSQVTVSRDVDATVNFQVKGFNSNPYLSGDGRTLAFLSGFNYPGADANKNTDFNGEIFLYRTSNATNNFTQVTETSGIAIIPVLLSDGVTYSIDASAPVNLLKAFTHPLNRDGSLLTLESAGNLNNSNADRTREVWIYNTTTKAFTQLTNQSASTIPTQDELKRIDHDFLPSINASGRTVTFASTLNLAPAGTSSVTTDNADGSKEIFRYDIGGAKFRQLTFAPASEFFLDQRINTTSSFIDDSGDLATFSFIARSLGANLPTITDLFQALVRPISGRNSQEAKIANAASFDVTQIARGSIGAIFGTQLANSTQSAPSTNLPFILNGVTVNVGSLSARLSYVSGEQINFVIPAGIANGDTVDFTINNNGVVSAGKVKIVNSAPGLFTINGIGTGDAAAQCGTISPDGMSFLVTNPPCSVGNESQSDVLTIYGTGWRNSATVQVKIGDQTLTPIFSGPQNDFLGLDQINVALTKDLAGKTDQDVSVVIPGTTAIESNKGKISFLPFLESLTVSNAASFEAGVVAPGSSAVVQGMNLADSTASGAGFSIAGVSARVAGSPAFLTYVSPSQINLVIPQDVKPANNVEVLVNNNGTISRGRVSVLKASPGLFTTSGDGNGPITAQCGRMNADGSVTYTNPPCSVGTEANPNILRVFGTGWRNADSVQIKVGDVDLTPIFSGAQPNTFGIDIIDANLVPSLANRTDVDVIVTTTVGSTTKASKAGVKVSFTGN